MPETLVDSETMERFARHGLGAVTCPDDFYRFSRDECLKCGGPTPMRLTIEHHTGSAGYDPEPNLAFAVASCLHFEEDGFFDDGVVVGQRPQCGKCRVLVKSD